MYLPKLPTYFVKGNERKAVYHTVAARELLAKGWNEEGIIEEKVTLAVEAPEVVEDESNTETEEESEPEPGLEIDLDSMTKTQLIGFAQAFDIEFKSNISKAELLEICKQELNG